MPKTENEGAITVTIKGAHAKILRDLMSDEKAVNRRARRGPTSYASIIIAALLEWYKGTLAERAADATRITEEAAAKRDVSPF